MTGTDIAVGLALIVAGTVVSFAPVIRDWFDGRSSEDDPER